MQPFDQQALIDRVRKAVDAANNAGMSARTTIVPTETTLPPPSPVPTTTPLRQPKSKTSAGKSKSEVKQTKQRKTRRVFLELDSFPIEGKLKSLYSYLQSLRSVEQTDDEKKDALQSDEAMAITISASKFLRFGVDATVKSADELNWFDQFRDIIKVRTFIQHIRDQGGCHSTIIKYLHAIAMGLKFLAQDVLTADQRSALNQTQELITSMKKPRSRAKRKEIRARNSRENMMENNEWVDASELLNVIQFCNEKADTLVSLATRHQLTLDQCIAFRNYTITLAILLGKTCRRMIYTALTCTIWGKLPRDSDGRKVFCSDKFKTSDVYGIDTLIFPVTVEKRIDQWLQYFRPILMRARTGIQSSASSSSSSSASASSSSSSSSSSTSSPSTDDSDDDDNTDMESTEEQTDSLFVTRYGTRHRELSTDIVMVFKNATGKHITLTSLRKILATETAERASEADRALLAKNDTHSLSTVKAYYEKKDSYEVARAGLTLQSKLIARAAERKSSSSSSSSSSLMPLQTPPILMRKSKRSSVSTFEFTPKQLPSPPPLTRPVQTPSPIPMLMNTPIQSTVQTPTPTPIPTPVPPPPGLLLGPPPGILIRRPQQQVPPPMSMNIMPDQDDEEEDVKAIQTPEKRNPTFTPQMDNMIRSFVYKHEKNGRKKIPWRSLSSHPIFNHVTSEQIRWRYRNLSKSLTDDSNETTQLSSRPPRVKSEAAKTTKKRKRDTTEDESDERPRMRNYTQPYSYAFTPPAPPTQQQYAYAQSQWNYSQEQ